MKSLLAGLALALGAALPIAASAQSAAPAGHVPPGAITVVIQITMASGAKPDAANAAMADMRGMIRKQPGLLSEELLQNVNPANSPSHVHVMRWTSFQSWENVFLSPEFAKLNAAGAKNYSIAASAFKTLQ